MTPPTRLQLFNAVLVFFGSFTAKLEPFTISQTIGGLVSPPYEVLQNSPPNGISFPLSYLLPGKFASKFWLLTFWG